MNLSNRYLGLYILDKRGRPKKVNVLDLSRATILESNRRVARTKLGPSLISTVFLGVDHNFGKGPPILWETMVFGGKLDQYQERCAGGKRNAKSMHRRVVARVKKEQKK